MRIGTIILAAALGSAVAAPATQACEMCRDAAVLPTAGASASSPSPAGRFNASVVVMLGGTLAMAGFAVRAMIQAGRSGRESD